MGTLVMECKDQYPTNDERLDNSVTSHPARIDLSLSFCYYICYFLASSLSQPVCQLLQSITLGDRGSRSLSRRHTSFAPVPLASWNNEKEQRKGTAKLKQKYWIARHNEESSAFFGTKREWITVPKQRWCCDSTQGIFTPSSIWNSGKFEATAAISVLPSRISSFSNPGLLHPGRTPCTLPSTRRRFPLTCTRDCISGAPAAPSEMGFIAINQVRWRTHSDSYNQSLPECRYVITYRLT